MANESLGKAKSRKNDEFYTVYDYIQKEMNAYLEYDPMYFVERQFCCLVTIQNGVILQNILLKILKR